MRTSAATCRLEGAVDSRNEQLSMPCLADEWENTPEIEARLAMWASGTTPLQTAAIFLSVGLMHDRLRLPSWHVRLRLERVASDDACG